MLTEKDYCDYETCVALKELGYPLTSKKVTSEDKSVFVPGLSLYEAHKWLREEKGIDIVVNPIFTFSDNQQIREYGCYIFAPILNKPKHTDYYKIYEDALYEGIKEAIKILKNL